MAAHTTAMENHEVLQEMHSSFYKQITERQLETDAAERTLEFTRLTKQQSLHFCSGLC